MEMNSQARRGSVPNVYEDMHRDREENIADQTTALTAAAGDDKEEYEVPIPPTNNLTVNSDQDGSDYLVTMADQRLERLTTKLRHQKICVIISIVMALLSTAGLVAYIFYSLEVNSNLTHNQRDLPKTVESQTEMIEYLQARKEVISSLTNDQRDLTEKMENQTEQIEDLTGRIEDLTGKLIKLPAIHDLAHPEDCHSLWEQGIRTSGVYTIWFRPGYGSEVRCDFDKSNGFDGSVDFYRDWDSYKTGFGDPHTEYWLGNDNIYYLTRTNRKLSIYLRNYMGEEGTANYSRFYINNEGDNYRLTISGYSGSVEDQMAIHNNCQFTTRDRDNDRGSANCAVRYTGSWWYEACYRANLNGVWTNSSSGDRSNMVWFGSWSGPYRPLQSSTMRVTRG